MIPFMKPHAYRPLLVIVAFVALILIVRAVAIKDKDFAAHEMGYRFGWHDKQNEEFWRDGFRVKYLDRDICRNCHSEKWDMLAGSPHSRINCQNCHAAEGVVAADHPEKTGKMAIDRSRGQCLRCHEAIPDTGSGRAAISKKVRGEEHNTGYECADCHNPHSPGS